MFRSARMGGVGMEGDDAVPTGASCDRAQAPSDTCQTLKCSSEFYLPSREYVNAMFSGRFSAATPARTHVTPVPRLTF